ncbi:MAG TPA: tetratricopeptide repeat protein [Trichormus sp.]|jgi:tetratricopeptide (TPR) repeat protein
MTESLLQVAVDWKRVFASATEAAEAQDYVRALQLLREAEALAQKLGEDDQRLGETLERIGFVYQSQGQLADAETAYRRALKVLEKRLLASMLKRKIRSQLAQLLEQSGRAEEAVELQNRPLPKTFRDSSKSQLEQESHAHKLMTSLKLLSRGSLGKPYPKLQPLMEEVLVHIENTYGAESMEVAAGLETMASFVESLAIDELSQAITTGTLLPDSTPGAMFASMPGRVTANQYYRRALHITAKNFGKDSMNVVAVMRSLAMTELGTPLSDALQAKANAIEKSGGFETVTVNVARDVVSKLTGEPPPLDMALSEAETIVSEFYQTPVPGGNEPFINLELSQEQITAQLLSLLEMGLAMAEECEANSKHPLQTICILAQLSDVHKEAGDIPKAKAALEREMSIIASKWGEGHIIMVEAMEKYGKL